MRKAERSEATRSALLRAGRALFAERGYAGTPIEEVVRRADVTRGALYHHFRDKRDLFRAVVESLEGEVTDAVARAALGSGDVWDGIVAGCEAFLDACLDPAVLRIVLTDAPSVLGLQAWREIEAEHGLAVTRMALETAMDDGLVDRQPVEPLAYVLLGALNEAALYIARAEDRAVAREEMGATVRRLLEGLRAPERPVGRDGGI